MLLLDQVERWVLAERHVAAVLKAAGADVDMPTFAEARANLDELLVSEFDRIDPRAGELRAAVGLGDVP